MLMRLRGTSYKCLNCHSERWRQSSTINNVCK